MKKLCIILGFIAAILAVILAVTPLSNLTIFPLVIAFLCGLIVLFISKKQKNKTKTIQYIFLLVIIALTLTIYKGVFNGNEIGDTKALEIREEENLKDSKYILEASEINDTY